MESVILGEGQMAPRLPVFNEALGREKGDELTGRELRQPRQQGIPTVNSSTCTRLSLCGMGWP